MLRTPIGRLRVVVFAEGAGRCLPSDPKGHLPSLL